MSFSPTFLCAAFDIKFNTHKDFLYLHFRFKLFLVQKYWRSLHVGEIDYRRVSAKNVKKYENIQFSSKDIITISLMKSINGNKLKPSSTHKATRTRNRDKSP